VLLDVGTSEVGSQRDERRRRTHVLVVHRRTRQRNPAYRMAPQTIAQHLAPDREAREVGGAGRGGEPAVRSSAARRPSPPAPPPPPARRRGERRRAPRAGSNAVASSRALCSAGDAWGDLRARGAPVAAPGRDLFLRARQLLEEVGRRGEIGIALPRDDEPSREPTCGFTSRRAATLSTRATAAYVVPSNGSGAQN
jgi:hypothetical protein